MAHRRFARGSAAIAQKRLTSWFEFLPRTDVLTATGGTIIFSLNTAALALRPFTIVRTRFLVSIVSDQLGADEIQIGAYGMAVVSDQAVAVGVTAVPTPITDMGSDLWFVHQMCYNDFQFVSGVGFHSDGAHQYEIDSKAMRKVDIGQDLVVVAEVAGASSGAAFVSGGRMLVKVN